MKILLDNVNVNSSSGPNSFGKRLMFALKNRGHEIGTDCKNPDVQLSFITALQKRAKLALRLDGIYFNSSQDWKKLNEPLRRSFEVADLIIYQSEFNRRLTEEYFGQKKYVVINNGTCLKLINKMPKLNAPVLDSFSEVWTCASSWRPHKRLKDNINYFLEKAPDDSCMVVAGENPDYKIQHPRVLYAGHLSWEQCISLYKRSKFFVHLAFLDHCPNVVVDARASGCNLVVSSSGGTREIAGPDAVVVKDVDWDMRPLELYSPPSMDFSKFSRNETMDCSVDILEISRKYESALETI